MRKSISRILAIAFTLIMIVTLLYTPSMEVNAAGKKLIAITFDDGPSGSQTGRLLDGLKARGAKATFFMNGVNGSYGVRNNSSLVSRMVREDHQIANHTWAHVVPFSKLSSSQMKSEVSGVNTYLYNAAGGSFQTFVRIPGGDRSSTISSSVDAPMILWSVDPLDWKYRNSNTVYNNIMKAASDGGIILVRDIHPTSVDGALRAISSLQSQGYEFVTVSELFRRRGVTPRNGQTYTKVGVTGVNLPAYKTPSLQSVVSKFGECKVVASTSDSGVTLRYTTDGSIPNLSSRKYTEPITVSANSTLHIRVAGFDKYGTRTGIADGTFKAGLPVVIFSADYYSNKYSDLKSAFGSDTNKLHNHFTTYGIKEGRQASPVFDVNFYKKSYADLKSAFGDDNTKYADHFVKYGMKEGRKASDTFEVTSYKNLYQDLRLAFGNDLTKYYEHYVKYGYSEGRKATGVTSVQNAVTKMNGIDYSLVYDYNFYVSHNPDVKKVFGNDDIGTLRHFVTYGMKEGRQAKATFNVNSYKNQYPDLRTAFGKDLKSYYMHYIRYGAKEGRKGIGCNQVIGAVTKLDGVDYSAVYNYQYYVAHNPDIKKAFGNDDIATLQHFVKYGMKEGRTASADFSLAKYKSRYADLRNAFGDDNAKYYLHYISYGKKEGRSAK